MRLSFIIIEYHCMDEVEGCVSSIREHANHIEHEVIVISNSCYSDDEWKKYLAKLEGVRMIRSARNSGYAGGVNQGLRKARGEYVYIINPDCRLLDDRTNEILDYLDTHKNVAIAGPKVVDNNGNNQPSCRRFPRWYTFIFVRTLLRKTAIGKRETARYFMENESLDDVCQVDWVSGGAMIVRMEYVEKYGGMDERYFLYMEDVDWCRNMRINGADTIYYPFSIVMHAGMHKSIKVFRLSGLRHNRMHICSLMKYFLKYRGT